MAPRPSSSKKAEGDGRSQPNEETDERKRLKSLAFSRKLLSHTPSKPISPLNPSKVILKHQGRDIVKKSQRKNRFLFSFPGLLAPISGGKIGELKDLGTKNPVLYMDFPQGRMKLFGTIVYPKNKYLTLQFSKGAKNVMCEDCFENMVVFSDAWWIGQKDENPEEVQLEFPKQLAEGKHSDYDFKGGAGATSEEKSTTNKPRKEYVESPSPDTELKDDGKEYVELPSPDNEMKDDGKEYIVSPSPYTKLKDDASDDSGLLTGKTENDAMEVTPVRKSTRIAGKTFKYAECSSGDNNSVGSDAEILEKKEERVDEDDGASTKNSLLGNTVDSNAAVLSPLGSENEDAEVQGKVHQSSQSVEKSKEASGSKRGTRVQATLTTLFDKMKENKSTRSIKKSPTPKGSAQKRQLINSEEKSIQVKVREASKKRVQSKRKNSGRKTGSEQKHTQVEDDDIEEISSD